jgi:hypothetical protein
MKLKNLIKAQKGLGDTVEIVTKVTGIKSAVESVTKAMGKEDCGCDRRKEQLNNAFPYKK